MIKEEIQHKISPILEKYDVKYAGVFGSAARGEERTDSDIDIVVSIGREMGIYEFMALQYELEEILNKKVDLVSREAINKYIRPYIEKDLINIYEGF